MLNEYLTAMILWDLRDPFDQESRDQFSEERYTIRALFVPTTFWNYVDRSGNGVDLVDFLDHFRAGLSTLSTTNSSA
jgi:hypothetical protein